MIIFNKENIKPFDVDDCLVIHNINLPGTAVKASGLVEILDPHTNTKVTLRVNKPMVRLLKEEKARGSAIIVWSRGGYQWAAAAVEALGLKNHVDLVLSKPLVYFDDRDVSEWLKDRVFIGPDTRYKV